MTLIKIAWRSIQQRSLASLLTGLSMALGVSLVVAVLVAGQIVDKSFRAGNGLGYNVIIGAKGGRLDLLLNTVYYLNRPIENIPWDYYKQFLHAGDRWGEGKDGEFAADVNMAIPLCLGDVLGEAGQYRVVGTTPEMFTDLLHSTFSSGECFKQSDFRAGVIGSEVARTEHLKVGDSFKPAHGVGGEKHMPFKITGILDRTGTPNDRAAFVNIEGFFLIPDHARGHVEEEHKPGEKEANPEDEVLDKPLPEDQREVTAVLVRTAGAVPELTAPDLVKRVNKEFVAQAIEPIREITVLNNTFVAPVQVVLLVLTVLIVIVAGVGILVSIYNSMSERQHEIAVMRALGAGRGTVMMIVLLESILLSLGGGLVGWLAGHLLVGAAGPIITDYTGVSVAFLQFVPKFELILIPGLIVLASLVGYLPALTAYRTDVARALTATP